MPERPHGYARYKLDGCRCYTCCFAASEYGRDVTRRKAYGTWQPFVDAAPARAHIAALGEAGFGWKRVAQLAGLSSGTMSKLLWGVPSQGRPPSAKLRAATAERILAVRPDPAELADHSLVNSIGTVRRLQALIRAGWTQTHLATCLGVQLSNFGPMLERDHVTAATARAVTELYCRLENADPSAHGVTPQGRSRAANYGGRRGWPLPAMWDDGAIDDPEAFPDFTGECGTIRGYHLHYKRRILPLCAPCRSAEKEEREKRADHHHAEEAAA